MQMGQKRKADRIGKSPEKSYQVVKHVKYSGLPASLKESDALRSTLLASTAQHRVSCHEHHSEDRLQRPGKTTRAMARAQADQEEATPIDLRPLALPPEHLTQEEILNRRLKHVQELKTFYGRVYMSMLSHLVDLASAMKVCQHPVLHELDPQVPRSSDHGKDANAETAAARASTANRSEGPVTSSGKDQKSPGKDSVTSPKAHAKVEGVTSPRAHPKVESISKPLPTPSKRASSRLPCFSDAEEEVLRHCRHGKNGASSALSSGLVDRLSKTMSINSAFQMVSNNMEGLADLERVACSAAARDMDAHEACAVLCGRRTRFYLHQTMTIIGRKSKSKGEVDVDLTLEGPSTKLSRIQCLLELDLEVGYVLRNLGRQNVIVDNMEVSTGHKIKVPHLSLLEIGGIHVLFLYNHAAVRRMALQQPPCPKDMVEHHHDQHAPA